MSLFLLKLQRRKQLSIKSSPKLVLLTLIMVNGVGVPPYMLPVGDTESHPALLWLWNWGEVVTWYV